MNTNVPTRPNPTPSSMGGPGTDPGTQQTSANLSPSTAAAPTPNKRGGAPTTTTRSSKEEEKVEEENGEGEGE